MKFKILIVLCLIIGGVVGYKYYSEKIEEETVKTYETEKIFRMDLTKTVSATGTVQPRDSVEVSSKITARIKEIPVKDHQPFRWKILCGYFR